MLLKLNPVTPLNEANADNDITVLGASMKELVDSKTNTTYNLTGEDEETIKDKKELMEKLSPRIKNDIAKYFFNKAPTPRLSMTLTCTECGTKHHIVSNSMNDFFD